jgi:16S rRNA processing protein RimM
MTVTIGDRELTISRRAGQDTRPILGVEGVVDRAGAEALRGQELQVPRDRAPELEADEWWAEDLEGCRVRDGERVVGTVRRLRVLPSCEVLEVAREGSDQDLLVPLVSDAVRDIDVEGRLIDVNLAFLGES